jgi:two-component system CheB/CheR fusion protein
LDDGHKRAGGHLANPKRSRAKKETTPPTSAIAAAGAGGVGREDGVGDGREVDRDESPIFPVVGIGASAGGLAAFESFFSGMPVDREPGMAFVLVQHLAPDHKSILTDLIRRYTRMQVFEVVDGMVVQPNCAYIIPPNCDMAFLNGTLQLMEPSAPRGQRLTIDYFFRSLAQDQRERAICIVLSGTGSDGTEGVKAVKGEGGMAMAQSPATTEYDGMPRSAIATGLVDFELSPVEMPARLILYASQAFGRRSAVAGDHAPISGNAVQKILQLLRQRSGHDFSQYKASTIRRRIERRMAVQQVETIDGYVHHLNQTPAELDALHRDLLIGVTSFFRDAEAFRALEEKALPGLIAGKPAGTTIRVWTPGCSTGEEAYSLAMLFAEHLTAGKHNLRVQIFATDIDSQAIATARNGLYPASIAADLSPERLGRFFSPGAEGGAYRINKHIRDMLIFSEQNVTRDPPFSRLDLISCRNLLIYMGAELQKKVVALFHYALNPEGVLFLGTSESVGDNAALFATLDRKAKLFRRLGDRRGAPRPAPGEGQAATATRGGMNPLEGHHKVDERRTSLRELTQKALLQQVAPAGALINEQGDILYLHGRTGQFLELAPGESGPNNILKMARDGLRSELSATLQQAVASQAVVRSPGLRVRTNGHLITVNLTVRPVTASRAASSRTPLFLVVLEELAPGDSDRTGVASSAKKGGATDPSRQPDEESSIEALRIELQAKEEYLQATTVELETANEEPRSANEELQSVNEELQSTNEELETSKEELQSVNEELTTINSELQTKVADLTRANNDLNNLLAGTGIATVFVDLELRITRFTPTATRIIKLISGDVGRPLGDIVSNLTRYDRIMADVRQVLDSLVPVEVEVEAQSGAWFLLRILPYRTLENVIEGAVITFVDVTDMKRAEEAAQESESHFRMLAESLPHPCWTCRPDGRSDYLSPQWVDYCGVPAARQTDYSWLDQIHPEDRLALLASWDAAAQAGGSFEIELRIRQAKGGYHWFGTRVTALHDGSGRLVRWFGLHLDKDTHDRRHPTPDTLGADPETAVKKGRET